MASERLYYSALAGGLKAAGALPRVFIQSFKFHNAQSPIVASSNYRRFFVVHPKSFNMPASTKARKFYLRTPDLEFRLNGPIKVGNVITDMTLPQDPITFLDPLPKIIPGSGYSKGKTESEHHASVNAGLAAKLYDVFGGQAEAKTSSSLKTIYAFDKVSAWYLEKNPTAADAKKFREKDDEFKNALRNGPVCRPG